RSIAIGCRHLESIDLTSYQFQGLQDILGEIPRKRSGISFGWRSTGGSVKSSSYSLRFMSAVAVGVPIDRILRYKTARKDSGDFRQHLSFSYLFRHLSTTRAHFARYFL